MNLQRRVSFTDRQIQILDLIAEGLEAPQIGRMLGVSAEAIKQCRFTCRRKIGLGEGESLKQWLYQNGWDKPNGRIRRFV